MTYTEFPLIPATFACEICEPFRRFPSYSALNVHKQMHPPGAGYIQPVEVVVGGKIRVRYDFDLNDRV